MSLSTVAAISVDRLLVLLLGLKYQQTVTLKRTRIVLATFWVISNVAASYYILDGRITFWYGRIFLPSYLVISFVSYTKIFRALSHRQVQVQDHVLQQPSQPSARRSLGRHRFPLPNIDFSYLCFCSNMLIDVVKGNDSFASGGVTV